MVNKEKILLWSLFGLLILSTIADMYTALSSGIIEIAEVNPVYLVTGNIWVLIIINVIIVWYIIHELSIRVSLARIYALVLILVFVTVGHLFGTYSNIKAVAAQNADPVGFEEARQEIRAASKAYVYFRAISVIMLMPMMLSFLVFVITHKIYQWRRPERERMIHEIKVLSKNLEE